jgi:peptidoglycan/xylan/chitin deacetylase (PgdA/CDA1 family)
LSLLAALLFLILTALPLQAGDHATAFVYHRFGDPRYPSTNITPDDFRKHLEILREEDYTVLTLGQVVKAMRSGKPLPERCAVLTVDDAYRSFLTGAMPLLREFDFPATLFVSTGTVGGADYLNWQELKSLAGEGIELGNHTADHLYLLDRSKGESEEAWLERLGADVLLAQNAFQKNLGLSPELFAYPYGEYDPEVRKLIEGLGFVGAAAQQSGVIAVSGDRYLLPRFPMGAGFVDPEVFRDKLLMKPLPLDVLTPQSPIVGVENPPLLRVRIDTGTSVALETLRCFVPGQQDPELVVVMGEDGVYEVRAGEPLQGRRSKYTLTASDSHGRQWFWFSQLWVFPRR